MTQTMQSETPRYWDDYEVGTKYPLGSTSFTADEIVAFARQFDPQSFHIDAVAARDSMFCAAKVPSRSRSELGVIHEHWRATNQKGELVMTAKGINMVRRRPA